MNGVNPWVLTAFVVVLTILMIWLVVLEHRFQKKVTARFTEITELAMRMMREEEDK